jgi:hypothetical protein
MSFDVMEKKREMIEKALDAYEKVLKVDAIYPPSMIQWI